MHERLLASASNLSDDALLDRVHALAANERSCTVELIAHLAELDTRNLTLRRGRSLYVYCTDVLHLSEHAAYTHAYEAELVFGKSGTGAVRETGPAWGAPRRRTRSGPSTKSNERQSRYERRSATTVSRWNVSGNRSNISTAAGA